VLKIEPPKKPGGHDRISLSLRALEPDPWRGAADRFPEGMVVPGRVVRLEPYGAFVAIAPGLDGLVHVSELAADRRVEHPRQVVEVGQEVTVRVLGVDAEKRRISLAVAAAGEGGEDGDPGGPGGAVSEGRPATTSGAGAAGTGGLGTLGDFFKAGKGRRPR
jgi:small subunit ribosomal protein S1